jgi:acyl carrier protein
MIKHYIQSELVKDKKHAALSDGDPLIESGIIDSLGIMKLIGFLEDKVSIQISDEELTPENFATVAAIVSLVQKKQGN